MHRISTVKISNFRSCKDVSIDLVDFTPIVGYNNAGKSNLIRAIEWLIEPKPLSSNDFFDTTKPIIVECTITGITPDLLGKLGAHKPKIEPHIDNDRTIIRTVQTSPNCSARDIRREIWLLDKLEWGNPQGIPQALQALFPDVIRIEAMIDINAELSSNKTTTTIGKLIKAIMEPIVSEQGDKINRVLDELNSLFGAEGSARAESLKKFDAQASAALQDFFPGVAARLDAPPPEIKEIFKSGKLVFSESINGEQVWRDINYYGHGVMRAAQMAMIKLLSNVDTGDRIGRTLLLIDEPELYMHPQMAASIRSSLRKLSKIGYQVIFTTHSPLLIGRDEIHDTIMVSKQGPSTSLRKTIRSCCSLNGCETQVDLLMLDLNCSSQFLFCDNAILVEGETEKVLLPELIEAISEKSLLENGTALITLNGSASIPKTIRVLNELRIRHKSIVDVDFAFRFGKNLSIINAEDLLYKACLAAFVEISQKYGFELEPNGLFKNSGEKKAEEAYHIFSTNPSYTSLFNDIQSLFAYNSIWIWSRGSIEYQLGMPAKGGDAIRDFREKLLTNKPVDAILDFVGTERAITWALK